MSIEAVAAAYHARQRAIAGRTALRIVETWAAIDPDDLDGSWTDILANLNRILAAAQLLVAGEADPYVARALTEQDVDPAPVTPVRAEAFVGRTADGRPNRMLLGLPVIIAKTQIAAGRTPADAVAVAGRTISRLAATEIIDTGRSVVLTSTAARPQIDSYVRQARGSTTCDRCRSRTNRVYSWRADFKRHPQCDCEPVPATAATARRMVTTAPDVPQSGMASVADLSRRSTGARAADEIIAAADSRAEAIRQLATAGYLQS